VSDSRCGRFNPNISLGFYVLRTPELVWTVRKKNNLAPVGYGTLIKKKEFGERKTLRGHMRLAFFFGLATN
jgi:hypothetical protein